MRDWTDLAEKCASFQVGGGSDKKTHSYESLLFRIYCFINNNWLQTTPKYIQKDGIFGMAPFSFEATLTVRQIDLQEHPMGSCQFNHHQVQMFWRWKLDLFQTCHIFWEVGYKMARALMGRNVLMYNSKGCFSGWQLYSAGSQFRRYCNSRRIQTSTNFGITSHNLKKKKKRKY